MCVLLIPRTDYLLVTRMTAVRSGVVVHPDSCLAGSRLSDRLFDSSSLRVVGATAERD